MQIFLQKSTLTFLLGVVAPSFQHPLPQQLTQRLAAAHMLLAPPPGWQATPIFDIDWTPYDYALRYPGRRLEVRYAPEPLASALADTFQTKQQKLAAQANPSAPYELSFHTAVLHATVGNPTRPQVRASTKAELAKPLQVLPAAVLAKLKAEWGAIASLVPSAAFGQRYTHCVVVGLFKNNGAAAYIYYLFDNQRDFEELVRRDPKQLAFHSLRFQ